MTTPNNTDAVSITPQSALLLAKVNAMRQQDIANIAWDVVLYGDGALDKIVDAYGLPLEALSVLETLPMFVAEKSKATKALQQDAHIGTRRIAQGLLNANIGYLGAIAADDMADARVRVQALATLARMAGLERVEEQDRQSGVMLQINFGESMGTALNKSATVRVEGANG